MSKLLSEFLYLRAFSRSFSFHISVVFKWADRRGEDSSENSKPRFMSPFEGGWCTQAQLGDVTTQDCDSGPSSPRANRYSFCSECFLAGFPSALSGQP